MTEKEYIQLVVNVAEAEIGYIEKASNSNLDSKTQNAGSANYTKYGRDMHNLFPSIMDFPAAWCDAFVDWCFYKAYGITNAKSLLGGNFDDYTVASAQLYKNKNAWYTSNPKVGDQIFFKNSSRICHTGLVVEVTSTNVITIEGNTSSASGVIANGGCVRKKSYPLTYSLIAGYGRPAYGKFCTTVLVDTNKESSTPTIKVESAKSFLKSIAGIYKTTANLNMRSGAGTSKTILTVIPKGYKVTCYGYYTTDSNGVKWYYVVYTNTNKTQYVGFVSSKYLNK